MHPSLRIHFRDLLDSRHIGLQGGQIALFAKSGMQDLRRQRSNQWRIHAKFRPLLARARSRVVSDRALDIHVSASSDTTIISRSRVPPVELSHGCYNVLGFARVPIVAFADHDGRPTFVAGRHDACFVRTARLL